MKTSLWFAVALATVTCAPLMAQQVNTGTEENASGTVAGAHVNDSTSTTAQARRGGVAISGAAQGSAADRGAGTSSAANGSVSGSATSPGPAAGSGEMSAVSAQLVGKLDTKSAKVGDQVVAKTTKTVRTADGTVIPKGTRLVGHVTAVAAHGKTNADSSLSLAFDHAQLRNGESIPIRSEIRSVAPSASAMEAASMQNEDMFAGGGMGGGAMAGGRAFGGARAGGGGLVGGSLHEASYVRSGAHSAVGSAGAMGGETAHAAGSVTGARPGLDRGVRASGSVSGAGTARTAAYATGIHGVMLAGDASGRSSGTLTASRQNVHLDSGTQMDLGVAREQ